MEKPDSFPSPLSQHLQPGPRKEETFLPLQFTNLTVLLLQLRAIIKTELGGFFGSTYLGYAGWHSCWCS